MDQSFCPKNSTDSYPKSVSTISKLLSQFYSCNRWTYKTYFFHFFRFYDFVNNKRTVIAGNFFRKYRYFNTLLELATHPNQIHRAVLERLRFEKKVKKIYTSNIFEIHGSILLLKELSRLVYKIDPYTKSFEGIKPILL